MQPGTPPIEYLFRFRDLVANTIEEHATIIRDRGSCWWGWWKRPTEGSRSDIWEPLRQEASVEHPVPVGLFHSGTGDVFRAQVSGVIPPLDQPSAALPVPDGDQERVPQYYRTSPYSRAWMKLTSIDRDPVQFFGSYSFTEAPQLSNYSPGLLARFRGKVIVNADELRSMDMTMWKVRPKQESDSSETMLLSTHLHSAPVSWESRDLKSNIILHITDPHLATGAHREQHSWRLESERATTTAGQTLSEAIAQALDNYEVALIVITGDLTFSGAPDEFEDARKFITRLLGAFDLDTDALVVVPGNHDILWTKQGSYTDDASVTEAPEEANRRYSDFYESLYRHPPNAALSMGRRFLLPSGVALEICALNSSSLETGKDFLAGMGRVQENAFLGVCQGLRWGTGGMSLRVVALHHHLVLTENVEPVAGYYRGFGIAVDAPRIMRLAREHGAQMALHGHKHRPFLWRAGVYELPQHTHRKWALGDLAVVGGGSAGSSGTEARQNYFNVIAVDGTKVQLTMFRSENAGVFQCMAKWNSPIELSTQGCLVLKDWEPNQQ